MILNTNFRSFWEWPFYTNITAILKTFTHIDLLECQYFFGVWQSVVLFFTILRVKICDYFLIHQFNICFGCSKELSHWDGSYEYSQHMFWFIFLFVPINCNDLCYVKVLVRWFTLTWKAWGNFLKYSSSLQTIVYQRHNANIQDQSVHMQCFCLSKYTSKCSGQNIQWIATDILHMCCMQTCQCLRLNILVETFQLFEFPGSWPKVHHLELELILASTWDVGVHHISEQQRLRQACTSA